MGRVILAIVLLWLAKSPQWARAQDSLPLILQSGLNLIDSGRPDSALALWAASDAFGEEERQQVRSSIPVFGQACGRPAGHDIVRRVAITTRIERVYLVVRCAVRPIYIMLALYEAPVEWKITALNWSTDPDRVLPEAIFGAQRP